MKPLPVQKIHIGLFVTGWLYPQYTGGMEIFNYYLLNYLLEESGDSIYYIGEKSTGRNKGHFVYLKNRRPSRFFYPIQFFIAVFKLRKTVNYAYLSFADQSWILPFSKSLVLRIFKIPYVVTIHWGKEPDWNFKYPYEYFFRHAHAIIGVSEAICSAYGKTLPGQDFLYIPPLIPFKKAMENKDVVKNQLGYVHNERILLFVGSLKPMKNPDKIIEAFRIIGSDFLEKNNIRLLFAGNGEMNDLLQDLVKKYELSRYIRFEGLVSREKIPGYYKAADFYVISSDYEGTSLSLMEAMFNSLAIIGSDTPGINGMLRQEQNALLYEVNNTVQLAETFIRIFSDAALAEKLSEQAYQDFCRLYSYENMIERYKSIFLAT